MAVSSAESLAESAAEASASQNVVYCNLTLQPLFVKSLGRMLMSNLFKLPPLNSLVFEKILRFLWERLRIANFKIQAIFRYDVIILHDKNMILSIHMFIFQAAISFWINAVSANLPKCDGVFE